MLLNFHYLKHTQFRRLLITYILTSTYIDECRPVCVRRVWQYVGLRYSRPHSLYVNGSMANHIVSVMRTADLRPIVYVGNDNKLNISPNITRPMDDAEWMNRFNQRVAITDAAAAAASGSVYGRFITARCTLVQSAVLPSHVVCLSVCP